MTEPRTPQKRSATDIDIYSAASPQSLRKRCDSDTKRLSIIAEKDVGTPRALITERLALQDSEQVFVGAQVLCDPSAKCIRLKAPGKPWTEFLSWQERFHEISLSGRHVQLGSGASLQFKNDGDAQNFVTSAFPLRMCSSQCAICREHVTAEASSVAKACRHRFCTTCIDSWAKMSSRCPICRREMELLISIQPDVAPREVALKEYDGDSGVEPDSMDHLLQSFVLLAVTYVVLIAALLLLPLAKAGDL